MTTAVQLYRQAWAQRAKALAGVEVRAPMPWHECSAAVLDVCTPVPRPYIRWHFRVDGILGLLHELGHILSGHLGDYALLQVYNYPFDFPQKQSLMLRCEQEAWLVAEDLARVFGQPFDYALAQRYYDSYSPHGVSPSLPWRHKP